MTFIRQIIAIAFLIINLSSFGQDKNVFETINNQVWDTFSEAFKTLDHELFEGLHHTDFIRLSGNSKDIKFKKAYIEGYKRNWKNKDRQQVIAFRFLVRFHNDNTASERSIYRLTIKPGSADEKSHYGKFHLVLKKEEIQWKILMDYDSDENNTIDSAAFLAAFAMTDYEKF